MANQKRESRTAKMKTAEELQLELDTLNAKLASTEDELDVWKNHSRTHEREVKKLKTDLDKTVESRVSEEVGKIKSETDKEIRVYRAKDAAVKAGIPEAAVTRLRGDTIEELEADALELAKILGIVPKDEAHQVEDSNASDEDKFINSFKPVPEQGQGVPVQPKKTVSTAAEFAALFNNEQ